MDDERVLADFEAAAIGRERWTHEMHVRVAFVHLRRMSVPDALARMREGIRRLNHANGVSNNETTGYHETLTVAWLRLVRAAMRSSPGVADFRSFVVEHPELLSKTVLRRYYSPERIGAAGARGRFVKPDLQPLPR